MTDGRDLSRLILTRVEEIEQALTRTLEREQCSADQGCSALANVLLTALVACKRSPEISAHVSDEMRRLAARLMQLAASEPSNLATALQEARLN